MKKMKFASLMIMMFGLILFTTSCKDDNKVETELTLNTSTLLLKGNDATGSINVSTNMEWNASVADSWCKITQGENTINIVLEPNPDTVYRETKITIVAGTGSDAKTEYVTVKQLGTGKAQILVNPNTVSMENTGAEQKVMFVVSVGDNVILPTGKIDSWLSVVVDPNNSEQLILTGDVNPKPIDRLAKVAVSAGFGKGMATDTIFVTQKGAEPAEIIFSSRTIVIPAAGTGTTVDVTTNMSDFSYVTPTGSDAWCSVSRNGKTLTFSADAITTEAGRTAKIAFSAGTTDNMVLDTLIVTQQGMPKTYNLWDVYKDVNGKAIGIVYQVSADGRHGMILSLDEYRSKKDMPLTMDDVNNIRFTTLEENPLGLGNLDNGLANLDSAKLINPSLDKFPPLKWADSKNVDGETGWCIPSIRELDTLYSIVFGCEANASSWNTDRSSPIYNPSYSLDKAVAFQNKISAIDGSSPFAIELNTETDPDASVYSYFVYGSSTERIDFDEDNDEYNNVIMGISFAKSTASFYAGVTCSYPVSQYSIMIEADYLPDYLYYYTDELLIHRYRAVKRF